jgi:hypothetical protein
MPVISPAVALVAGPARRFPVEHDCLNAPIGPEAQRGEPRVSLGEVGCRGDRPLVSIARSRPRRHLQRNPAAHMRVSERGLQRHGAIETSQRMQRFADIQQSQPQIIQNMSIARRQQRSLFEQWDHIVEIARLAHRRCLSQQRADLRRHGLCSLRHELSCQQN